MAPRPQALAADVPLIGGVYFMRDVDPARRRHVRAWLGCFAPLAVSAALAFLVGYFFDGVAAFFPISPTQCSGPLRKNERPLFRMRCPTWAGLTPMVTARPMPKGSMLLAVPRSWTPPFALVSAGCDARCPAYRARLRRWRRRAATHRPIERSGLEHLGSRAAIGRSVQL